MNKPWEIVLGPPGTGKTEYLLGTVDRDLANGISPDRIGYVTFTTRGTTEAQTRATERYNLKKSDLPWFKTLHALCMRALGISSKELFLGDHLDDFSKVVNEQITGKFSMEEGLLLGGYTPGDRMLTIEGLARVRCVSVREVYDQYREDIDWWRVERFCKALRLYKKDHALYDYTDLLEQFVERGNPPKLDRLKVDEAQDLSELQWAVVRKLAAQCESVTIAGDDDQALYVWAGAAVKTFIELPGNVTVLDQSYRVPKRIQEMSQNIISKVSMRRPKFWKPREADGSIEMTTGLENVSWEGESVLFLARNKFFLGQAIDYCKSSGIYYEQNGYPSIPKRLSRGIVAWEYLRQGKEIPASDVRVVYDLLTLGKGVKRGHKTLSGIPDDTKFTMSDLRSNHGLLADPAIWHEALDGIPTTERMYILRCRRQGERLSIPPRVRISTIHGSKGAQADRVILSDAIATRTYQEYMEDPDPELRVWYVAVSRAKKDLIILKNGSRSNSFSFS